MSSHSLKNVFIECQDSQNQHQLIKAFNKLYHSTAFDEFWPIFVRLIKHPLVVYAREPAVEKTIEFITKAVTDVAMKDAKTAKSAKKRKTEDGEENEDEDEEDMHPLLLKLFEFLLEVHNAKEKAVRFRICQLVTRLLQNLGEGAKIDDLLYDRIYRCMIERLRDKCPLVRVHAVLALTRLQDPTDETCPINKAYIILMTRDPNVEVRRIILTCIAPSMLSLPAILERTHDVKDTVRRTAYTVIAEKVPLRALSIEQRIQLLQDGLNDRSELVQNACSGKLLQAWLCACEGNVLDLLARLDVEGSVKTCEKALSLLFKSSGILDLVEKFDIINEKTLIDDDKLTCESAFYWRNIIQFIHAQGHEYEEQLDRIRPNCVEFCSYVTSFAKQLSNCSDVDKMLDLEFTLQQLLQMISYMDLSDQASRKITEKLLHRLLISDNVGPTLIPHILPCLKLVYTDTDNLVCYIAETISEIREPITTVEIQMTGDARRNIDKKIAGIRVKLHQLREELSDSIEKQDFERAAKLKADISDLDTERSSLLEESQPKLEEVRTQKDDPLTVLKCLTIVCELFTAANVKTLTTPLHALMESQILPGMVNEEAEVRNVAVKAIGLCCLIKRDIVMQHLPLFLQATQMDTQLVRATALKAVFDLIHVYGLEAFGDADASKLEQSTGTNMNENSTDSEAGDAAKQNSTSSSIDETGNETTQSSEEEKKGWGETATKVISILSAMLDNESSELRSIAAEGLAKLLLSGRVVSAKLLSHLLLLWYNPLVEDDEILLQCLGIFFPLFAFSGSANQELVEEAFLPTLKTLLRAPSTSPLAEINEVNVASFFIELTDAQHLVDNQGTNSPVRENPCHDSIAVKLCNEVLSNPESFNNKLWLRILGQLYISPDNTSLLKDLLTMSEEMAMVVTEKQCVKLLEKFRENLSTMLDAAKKQTTTTDANSASCEESACAANDGRDTEDKNASEPSVAEAKEDHVNKNLTGSATRKPRDRKSVKTPAASRSAHANRVQSALKSGSRRMDASALDGSVFATPAPLKGSRLAADVEDARVNLENLLMEPASKTPAKHGKTPKTPKRPLHTIQDPVFTG